MKNKGLRSLVELLAVTLFFFGVSAAVTWPIVLNMDSIVVGGGELGGWLWRQWWHFEEVRALKKVELGACLLYTSDAADES